VRDPELHVIARLRHISARPDQLGQIAVSLP
jgi:hypothetical protein